jgi:RimJ/RimL family protein N-acetyltransferase
MVVLETERLQLRQITEADAEFVVGLLNQPSFLQFIGDKQVRSIEDALNYIRSGPLASYEQHGWGLYLVQLKESGHAIGTCGILKKNGLEDPDLGFAFLPEHWSKGYAYEAAAATVAHVQRDFALHRICAVVNPENEASIKVLRKVGMARIGSVQLAPDDAELDLFHLSAAP